MKQQTIKKEEVTGTEPGSEYRIITVNQIYPSPTNPRKNFNDAEISELAKSILSVGIINPITVRYKVYGVQHYEIVAGEKRYRASKLADLQEVPCIVKQLTDQEVLEIQIIENLHRSDVHPLDEANGYLSLMEKSSYDIQSLIQKFGKSDFYIYQRLKLLDLIAPAKKYFYDGIILLAHATLLARLQSIDQEKALRWMPTMREGGKLVKDYIESPGKLRSWIDTNIMMDLHKTSFKKNDTGLVPSVGACTECHKRTGFNKNLFPDLDKKDFCTDPVCFNKKLEAVANQVIKTYKTNNVELVKIGAGYSEQNKNLIYGYKYEDATKKKCESAKPAVIFEGLESGKVIDICLNDKCKIHHPYSSGCSSDRNKPTPIERYKRKLELIAQPEALDNVVAIGKEILQIKDFPANHKELMKIIIPEVLNKVQSKDFIIKSIFSLDKYKGQEYQDLRKNKVITDYLETLDVTQLFLHLFVTAIYSHMTENCEAILRDQDYLKIINVIAPSLVDVNVIKEKIAPDYEAKRKKAKDSFIRINGFDPDAPKKVKKTKGAKK